MRRGFAGFLLTQALGAFNDNAFKTYVALSVVAALPPAEGSRLVGIAGALFIAPFLLFSTVSGWVCDRWSKRSTVVLLKGAEVGLLALYGSVPDLLLIFLMGAHSAFFSPAKLALVPELVEERDLSRANGYVQMTTFTAIILGTACAGWLVEHPSKAQPLFLAVAALGFLSSLTVPRTAPSAPGAALRLSPLPMLAEARRIPSVWLALVGSAFFWFVAAVFQMGLVAAAPGSEAARLQIVVALSIGAGSLLAGRLSRDQVELGLVPLGALGIVAGAFMPLSRPSLILLGVSAGLYALPLQAFIQQRAPAESRGRVMAALNLLSFTAVLLASGFFSALKPGISFPVVGCMTVVVAGHLLWTLPDFFLRLLMLVPAKLLYKIRVEGVENVPKTGPVLLVSNHVSFIDAFLIGMANPRLVRFLMFRAYYDLPVIGWVFRALKCIPISDRDGAKALVKSMNEAREILKSGEVVCIFAEGEISRHGQMLRFKKGYERIVDGLDVPVVPVHLDQVWGSVFSFSGGRALFKAPRRIPYPVTVSFGKALPKDAGAFACRQAIVELSAEAFRHRLEGHARTLGRAFISSALRNFWRTAVEDSLGTRYTYLGLLLRALCLKLPPGKRVGILIPPSAGAVVVNVACALQGRVAVNLNYTLAKEQLDACRAKCDVVIDRESKVGLGSPAIGKAELAAILFTSGSTGKPKGVMLTHENILSNVMAVSQVYDLRPSDRILGVLPFFHSFGFTATLWLPLLSGMSAVYHYNPLDVKTVGRLAADCTMILATPTFLTLYARKVDKLRARVVVTGAERLREEAAKAFEEKFGIRPLEGYGCTELSPVAAVNIPDIDWPGHEQAGAKPGSVGKPLPGVFMKVVDPETGAEKAVDEPGLLLVKGPNVMKGYLDEPERTAEVMRDGFYVTGDIGSIDADGFVTLTDRLSRFSKLGGEMVPHIKVEEALHQAAGLSEQSFVVVAGKDERLIVFHKKGVDLSKKPQGLPNLWVPDRRDYRELEEFPLLGTGKLDLRKLKELACS